MFILAHCDTMTKSICCRNDFIWWGDQQLPLLERIGRGRIEDHHGIALIAETLISPDHGPSLIAHVHGIAKSCSTSGTQSEDHVLLKCIGIGFYVGIHRAGGKHTRCTYHGSKILETLAHTGAIQCT